MKRIRFSGQNGTHFIPCVFNVANYIHCFDILFPTALFLSAHSPFTPVGGKAHENVVFHNYLHLARGFSCLTFLKLGISCQRKTHIYFAVAARELIEM
jgi:hypothetical protein